MMGLQGLFVVEENRPNNWLQTLNIGAGQVRVPSAAVRSEYDREYDLHYLDIDIKLNNIIQQFNDPRLVAQKMHRQYDITDATSDLFTLNGRSFPYTFRESLLVTKPNERVKLRIVNGGSIGVALHTHGHKTTITALDGVPVNPLAQITRDVIWIASAQRVDLALETANDGLHSYGSGVWLMHDHQGKGITTNGIGPGGNISAIVYEDYLGGDGWPKMQGMKWDQFFSEAYYRKELSIWQSYAADLFGEPTTDFWLLLRLIGFGIFSGVSAGLIFLAIKKKF